MPALFLALRRAIAVLGVPLVGVVILSASGVQSDCAPTRLVVGRIEKEILPGTRFSRESGPHARKRHGPGPVGSLVDTVRVAVAANFAATQSRLASAFEAGTGHHVVAIVGSTGQLYAQIMNGAPFDVFLSADRKRVALLLEAGAAVEGTRFTYARGQLVLYAPTLDSIGSIDAELRGTDYRRLALANPTTAPYGAAAMEVLDRLGLRAAVASKLVRGENVTQTLQFVKSGAAELGFVAWSQVLDEPGRTRVLVPDSLYSPIAQDAVLLVAGESNPAARAYLAFLRGDVARRVIRAAGYETR
jgi:molybdate transport system substrate-binding protein